jgi:hypothetical protein
MLILGLLTNKSVIARGINKGKLSYKKPVSVSTISISYRWHSSINSGDTNSVFTNI